MGKPRIEAGKLNGGVPDIANSLQIGKQTVPMAHPFRCGRFWQLLVCLSL
jgi:hypothetical protein